MLSDFEDCLIKGSTLTIHMHPINLSTAVTAMGYCAVFCFSNMECALFAQRIFFCCAQIPFINWPQARKNAVWNFLYCTMVYALSNHASIGKRNRIFCRFVVMQQHMQRKCFPKKTKCYGNVHLRKSNERQVPLWGTRMLVLPANSRPMDVLWPLLASSFVFSMIKEMNNILDCITLNIISKATLCKRPRIYTMNTLPCLRIIHVIHLKTRGTSSVSCSFSVNKPKSGRDPHYRHCLGGGCVEFY
jgi:hypothetical protein